MKNDGKSRQGAAAGSLQQILDGLRAAYKHADRSSQEVDNALFDAIAVLEREVNSGWLRVPATPPDALLASMAMRYRHDFGLLDSATQEGLKTSMRQLYEEATGQGFFSMAATGDA